MTHSPKIETSPETGAAPVFDSRPNAETIYHAGGALKAINDGRIGGYLVVFGSAQARDSYGEWFTASTDFGLERYKNQPVLFHHGQNDQKVCCIGIIDTLRVDANGVYAEAQLDVNHEDPAIRRYARTAYDQVHTGKLFWSSGSAGHLVRNTEDGEITQWWIVEGSLTPKPAEQSGRTQISVLRAAMKAFLDENSDTPPTLEDSADKTATLVEPRAKEQDRDRASNTPIRSRGKKMTTAMKMDMATIMSVLDGSTLDPEQKWALATALAAADTGEVIEDAPATLTDEPVDPNLPPAADPMASRSAPAKPAATFDAKAMANDILQRMKTSPAEPLPGGGGHNPATPRNVQVQVRSPYADMSVEDMAFLNDRRRLMGVRTGYAYTPPTAFLREMVEKAQKGIKSGALKSLDQETSNRLMAIKDNELDNTQTANQASDWVPTLWTSELWRRVRVDNNVAASIRTIEMPSQVYELPVESTDPTVSKVPETTNESQLTLAASGNPIPDSVLASAKKTLTAVKLGLRVGFSTEMEEDSIIPWIPQLREQSMRAMLNAVDNVIVNGDTVTTASTNINDIAGTPAATDKFLVFNGMRKLGLVTNTTVSTNAGGASPTLQMIRQARFKMISAGNAYALYPQNLVMFCDPYTYGKVLNIDELNVWMNNGRNATVNTGQVPLIDGVELYPSSELLLANTAGKVDQDTAANNTTGTIIIAARLGWTLGYRRQINTSVDFLPYYDSYQFTATVRLALINQDTVSASVIYNIGV
jgi:hypothetical protein